jgi:hypothetical protein
MGKFSPLKEPSPFDLEFEDMLLTKMLTTKEDELLEGMR